jgi:hypothetical protein
VTGLIPRSCSLRDDLTRRALLAASLLCALPARAEEVEVFTFDTLYKSIGVRGIAFSDRLLGAQGKVVALPGYMAPPLQAESDFFVLTREPMAICPFCQSDADWPVDIMVVYLARQSTLVTAGTKVHVRGRLEIGSWTDPATGFVSQLRLREATFRKEN